LDLLHGKALQEMPTESFEPPEGIVFVKVDLDTGLPPEEGSQTVILEAFMDGAVPGEKEGQERQGTPVRGRSPEDTTPAPSGY